MKEEHFDLAIIDADSILYQIAYIEPSPALCKKQLDMKLREIMLNTGSREGAIFIKGSNNFRYAVDVAYKGNRKDTIEPDVKERIDMLYKYCLDFAVSSDNGEADDYCGIYASAAYNDKKSSVVCHIDKDLNGIIGWHYNFKTGKLYYIDDTVAYRFIMNQLLTGDSTDNIQGLRGVGPKTAEKLTKDTHNDRLWDKVIEVWKDKQGDSWYNNFVKCANCIYIRESADDLRPLTFDELKDRLSWTTGSTDTGIEQQIDQKEPLDFSMESSGQPEDNTLVESN